MNRLGEDVNSKNIQQNLKFTLTEKVLAAIR